MNEKAKGIISLGCLFSILITVLNMLGLITIGDWFNHAASGWCVASLIAVAGSPVKRPTVKRNDTERR